MMTAKSVSTKQRILQTTADLIARQGYHATTTRQIADQLSIQQPSLFHHFSSKSAIVNALLAWDLDTQLPLVRELAADHSRSPLDRLKQHLQSDLEHVMNSPYNLAGVFGESVMSDPQFRQWREKREALYQCIAQIIQDGVDAGEFIPINARLGAEMVSGVVVSMLTQYSGRGGADKADVFYASFVILRGLLVDPLRVNLDDQLYSMPLTKM